jgi:hypothetical protein
MAYYAGGWALIHFFRNGPDEQRTRFESDIHAMNGGARANEARAHTLGADPPEVLEREFRKYVAGYAGWDLMRGPVVRSERPVIEQVRALTDEELHLLWVNLLPAVQFGPRLHHQRKRA